MFLHRACSVDWAGIELAALLSQPPGFHGYRHMSPRFTFKSTIMTVENYTYFIFHFIIKICIILQNICKKF